MRREESNVGAQRRRTRTLPIRSWKFKNSKIYNLVGHAPKYIKKLFFLCLITLLSQKVIGMQVKRDGSYGYEILVTHSFVREILKFYISVYLSEHYFKENDHFGYKK